MPKKQAALVPQIVAGNDKNALIRLSDGSSRGTCNWKSATCVQHRVAECKPTSCTRRKHRVHM